MLVSCTRSPGRVRIETAMILSRLINQPCCTRSPGRVRIETYGCGDLRLIRELRCTRSPGRVRIETQPRFFQHRDDFVAPVLRDG